MKICVKKGSFSEFDCEAVVVCHFEDSKRLSGAAALLDKKCGGIIREMIGLGDFEGKLFQISVIYTRGFIPARRIFVVGLGKKKDFDLEKLRGAFSKASRRIRELNLKGFATSLDLGKINQPLDKITESVVEGVLLGLYQFTPYKTVEREKIKELKEFVIAEDNDDSFKIIKSAAKTGEIISGAVNFARDLVSTPGNEMTPAILSDRAGEIARKKNVKLKVLDVPEMEKLGMNALLGVAKGSDEPPKFIVLEYNGGKKGDKVVALVGKGITFDSGGISIKPSADMDRMKTDMAGSAAVLGAIKAASDLKIPLNVVGLIPATENLPGGGAYKPGDILKSMSGQTIEIKNTDAEGRLVLADALTYAGRFKPEAIVDLATLTGACVIALGDNTIGMMGTDDKLKKRVKDAAEATGERLWELPLWEEYHELMKSDVADLKNTGGRAAGTITAAAFLSKFVGDYPWVHLDIAGPAWLTKDKPYIPKGASGVGVRLLVQFMRNL
ncbi:MAG: leucyl aminopeptidase [Proteobacteria bacterium]|nr:leucyl aminopeptidase [Pseudomonadota bacterium]